VPVAAATIVPVGSVQAAVFRPTVRPPCLPGCRSGQALEFVIIILLLIILVAILIWDNRNDGEQLEEEIAAQTN
jgi:hypothetical protein